MHSDNLIFAGNSINRTKEEAFKVVQSGDLILVKGRSSQKFARVAYALKGDLVLCRTSPVGKQHLDKQIKKIAIKERHGVVLMAHFFSL